MLTGIVGDVIGSVYEGYQWKNMNQELIQPLPVGQNPDIVPILKNVDWVRKNYSWTDDTLCTLALYWAYKEKASAKEALLYFCKKYGNETIGFGKSFNKWLENPVPYESFGNGCLMRIGFIPYLNISLEDKIKLAENYTGVSHNHRESFQAVYEFINLMHNIGNQVNNEEKDFSALAKYLIKNNYDTSLQAMHEEAKFEITAKQTLLQAVQIVLQSDTIEEVFKNAFYVGGDCDTLACIAGNLASSLFKCPEHLMDFAFSKLEPFPELFDLVKDFQKNYNFI